MKQKLLLLLFLFGALLIHAQETNLKSTDVVSAESTSERKELNITKWRLGEVHVIVLQQDKPDSPKSFNWNVNTYPNPFTDRLNLQFETDKQGIFAIQLTDLSGKKILYNGNKIIQPNQLVHLDLAFLSPGFYLVTVIPEDNQTQHVIKVQKL